MIILIYYYYNLLLLFTILPLLRHLPRCRLLPHYHLRLLLYNTIII